MKEAGFMLKKILLTLFIILILAVLIQLFLITGTKGQALQKDNLRSDVKYSPTPTLLIPGWAGNALTYAKLIHYYQKENIAQKTMTVHVSPTGKIHVSGTVAGKKNALIQVIFDWNYTKNYLPQVTWLTNIMKVLHHQYGVTKLNVVAHSWGGTAWIHAVANSRYIQKNITFNKVILLGVPINESFSNKISFLEALKKKTTDKNYFRLVKKLKKFDPQKMIHFYNIMGTKSDVKASDGSVPHVQSEFLKTVLKDDWSTYHQIIYQNTTHSGLHERKKVLNKLASVLWE